MRKRLSVTSIACLSLASAVLIPNAALASTDGPDTFNTMSQAQIDTEMLETFGADSENMYVLDASTAIEDGDEVFYPMPAESEDSLKITPELAKDLNLTAGEVPQDESKKVATKLLGVQAKATEQLEKNQAGTSNAAAKLNCRNTFVTPIGTAWSTWINSRCSLIGSIQGKKPYSFSVQAGSNTLACGEGIGFTWRTGSNPGTVKKAYGLGCGSSGGATAPWQNVAGYPQFRAKSGYLGFFSNGAWY